jgi:hypothetical protein
MDIERILKTASTAYSGDDALSAFIAAELREVCRPGDPDGDQLASAVKAMQNASDELADVAEALSRTAVARAA